MKKYLIKNITSRPTIYLVNTNKTDSTQAPNGYENIKVLPHIPYIQDKPFKKKSIKYLETSY